MRTSEQGREFIKREEGLELEVYPDGAGLMSVGYGHLLTEDDNVGMKITLEEAEEFFDQDIQAAEDAVTKRVTVPLEQHQFDACVSLCYNVGAYNFKRSTLSKLLNGGDLEGAANEFKRWVFASGKRLKGLERRRARELDLFVDGEYGSTGASS